MPTIQQMEELIQTHLGLDEAISAAVWIRQSDPTAWLVEVLSELPHDPNVSQPFVFSPGIDFRFALHLIAGNFEDVMKAVKTDEKLAKDIAQGTILYEENDIGKQLKEIAKGCD
jgi:hypothetical protein